MTMNMKLPRDLKDMHIMYAEVQDIELRVIDEKTERWILRNT